MYIIIIHPKGWWFLFHSINKNITFVWWSTYRWQNTWQYFFHFVIQLPNSWCDRIFFLQDFSVFYVCFNLRLIMNFEIHMLVNINVSFKYVLYFFLFNSHSKNKQKLTNHWLSTLALLIFWFQQNVLAWKYIAYLFNFF